MRVFTCLSRNTSIALDSSHKSTSLISKFNFKQKKRRSGPYNKRPTTPPRGVEKEIDENTPPVSHRYNHIAAKGRPALAENNYSPMQKKLESSTSASQSRMVSRRLSSHPLPPIPSNPVNECDPDYLPHSHVCSPLREDNSQDTTTISVGIYDLPITPQRRRYEAMESMDMSSPTCVSQQSCDYVFPRANNFTQSCDSNSVITNIKPVNSFNEAFVQSTGSLPHRTVSGVAISTVSKSVNCQMDISYNQCSHIDSSCQYINVDSSSQYNSIDTSSQIINVDTSSQYTIIDTSSQYNSVDTTSQYNSVDTSSQYISADTSSQYTVTNSTEQYTQDSLSTTQYEATNGPSGLCNDYYNVSRLNSFRANVIQTSDPHDSLEEEDTMIDVEHVSDSRASEFLGCMSFGVQSLLKKDLDGWYYLLTEEVGRKKHLQAHTNTKPVLTARSHQNIPQFNKVVDGLERIMITVQRGKNGFGFSFVGEFPPRVGRVDRASPAEQAGIKKGDMVVKINGQNVSRSTCEGVAHLVKKMNPNSLTLELQRDHVVSSTIEVTAVKGRHPHHLSPYNKRGVGTSTDHLYESITDSEQLKENWVDGVSQEFDDETVYSQHHNPNMPGITSTPRAYLGQKSTMAQSSRPINKHESIHRLMSLELDYIDFMHYGIERFSRPLRHCIVSAHQHMTIFQNVEKLVTISEYHIKQMQENNSSVDSDTEDSQSGESGIFPNSVALIYQSKIHMLCQAYETYANGLIRSNDLLRELRKNKDFMSFVKESSIDEGQGHPSISAFINRPVQHIQELYGVLSEIFQATPLHSTDFAMLQQIVIKLSQCVTAITGLSSAGRVQSFDSLTSSQGRSQANNSDKGSLASLTSCSSAEAEVNSPLLPSSAASVRSINRDVMRIQERLVFAPNVPTFELCQETRHLIYQGKIYRCNKDSWFKSQLLLFTDLLLIVDEDADGSLIVSRSSIYVQDIIGMEVERNYASEFVLHLEASAPATLSRRKPTSASSRIKTITLRAPSAQEKFVWQSLLEQRVEALNGCPLQYFGTIKKTSMVL